MKVLLLGANGFLGSNLHDSFLKEGIEISVISYRPESESKFIYDISNKIQDNRPDAIIIAGSSQNRDDDPSAINDLSHSNILLPSYVAWNIKQYAPESVLVTFGSSWQYSDNILMPFDAYAATKTAAEEMLKHYAQDGLRIASLMLHDTYGPKDKRKKVVNLIADALINNSPLDMTEGDQLIDLIHIDDVVSAVFKTIEDLQETENGCLKKYSVRAGKPITIKQLTRVMSQITELNPKDYFNMGIYDYHKRERFTLENDRPPVPGWQPKVDLKKGLSELIADRNG